MDGWLSQGLDAEGFQGVDDGNARVDRTKRRPPRPKPPDGPRSVDPTRLLRRQRRGARGGEERGELVHLAGGGPGGHPLLPDQRLGGEALLAERVHRVRAALLAVQRDEVRGLPRQPRRAARGGRGGGPPAGAGPPAWAPIAPAICWPIAHPIPIPIAAPAGPPGLAAAMGIDS